MLTAITDASSSCPDPFVDLSRGTRKIQTSFVIIQRMGLLSRLLPTTGTRYRSSHEPMRIDVTVQSTGPWVTVSFRGA